MNQNKRYKETKLQKLVLNKEELKPFILDIGGGGEGYIGKLYGEHVIAIDKLEQELLETDNKALKIVMDATSLKFLEESFEVVTIFYSLMYMNKETKLKVLNEALRVLKPGGIIDIWDMEIPLYDGSEKDILIGRLEVNCNGEIIETGYGVVYDDKTQSIESISSILCKLGMKKIIEEKNEISLRLRYKKSE